MSNIFVKKITKNVVQVHRTLLVLLRRFVSGKYTQ